MSEELKPCPFCGTTPGDGRHQSTQGDKWGSVVCECCGCVGPEVRTQYREAAEWGDAADEAWNDRYTNGD